MDIKDIEILIESLLEKKRHLDEEADKLATMACKGFSLPLDIEMPYTIKF